MNMVISDTFFAKSMDPRHFARTLTVSYTPTTTELQSDFKRLYLRVGRLVIRPQVPFSLMEASNTLHLMLICLPIFLRCMRTMRSNPKSNSVSSQVSGLITYWTKKYETYTIENLLSECYTTLDLEKNVTLQQSRAFKDRFFPQCPRYSSWPYNDRVTLYRSTQILPSYDFAEFTSATSKLAWLASHNIGSESENTLYRYTSELKRNAKDYDAYIHSLYRLFLCSKRAVYLAHLLKCDIPYLVRHIDEYYKKVDYYNLKTMYDYESGYSKSHPVQDLVFIYPKFAQEIEFYNRRSFQRLTLPDHVSFGIESFKLDMLMPPELKKTFDYQVMARSSEKIYKDTHKASDISKYRHSEKLRRLNPSLQKILIAYES